MPVSSNSHFHLLLSHIGRVRGSWSAGGLPRVMLYGLWLRYFALIFVCLMQLLSYMIGMKSVQ